MDILRAFFSFYGRMNRGDYLVVLGTSIAALIFVIVAARVARVPGLDLVMLLIIILSKWAMLAGTAKRFRDLDWSGWTAIFIMMPLVGFVILIILIAKPGIEGSNRFGPEMSHFFKAKGDPSSQEAVVPPSV